MSEEEQKSNQSDLTLEDLEEKWMKSDFIGKVSLKLKYKGK